MGIACTKSASASSGANDPRQTERVVVRIVSSMQNRMAWWRRWHMVVDPKGAVIHGLNMRSYYVDIGQEYEDFVGAEIPRIPLLDPSASQLLVAHAEGKFWMVPPPEKFTRHFGAALIIGDRHHNADPYEMKVGDVIRLGSVGLVVIEVSDHEGNVDRIAESELQFLRDSADELKGMVFDEDATTARQEKEKKRAAAEATEEVKQDEKDDAEDPDNPATCYMCFDSEETPENPLIAPCDCLGDTRYVHIQCLQKWNGIGDDEGASVVCTTQGPAVCKVCKRRYKLRLKTGEGQTVPLLYKTLPPPYVCFLVVTKHENSPTLFGAQYQVSPARTGRVRPGERGLEHPCALIGRSHQCDMVVNYRTVSTQHARVFYDQVNRTFFLEDLRSSNGTSLFLRRPLQVPSDRPVKIRLGRTTMLVKTQASWNFFTPLARYKVTQSEIEDTAPPTVTRVTSAPECNALEMASCDKDNNDVSDSKFRHRLSSLDGTTPLVTLDFLNSLSSLDNMARRLVTPREMPTGRIANRRRNGGQVHREDSQGGRQTNTAAVSETGGEGDEHPAQRHQGQLNTRNVDMETISSMSSQSNISDARFFFSVNARGHIRHMHRRHGLPRPPAQPTTGLALADEAEAAVGIEGREGDEEEPTHSRNMTRMSMEEFNDTDAEAGRGSGLELGGEATGDMEGLPYPSCA